MAVPSRGAGHPAARPSNENRRVRAGIVPQRIRLILDILADDSDKQRPRQLVLELCPEDATDVHERAVRATIHLLPEVADRVANPLGGAVRDRKSTRLNSSHSQISYAVFCL